MNAELPFVPHRRRVAAFLVTVVLVGVAGVVLGSTLASQTSTVQSAVELNPVVTAELENRAISSDIEIQAAVTAGSTVEVKPVVQGGADSLPLVTKSSLTAGSLVSNGELLLEIMGRPLVVLGGGSPLYRSLGIGDTGNDVEAFESALSRAGYGGFDIDSEFTEATLEAASELWEARGYDLPERASATSLGPSYTSSADSAGATPAPPATQAPPAVPSSQPYVSITEIVQIPADTATVASILPLAASIGSDTPVAALQVGANTVRGRASVTDADALPIGTSVLLRAAGKEAATSVVTEVSDFIAASTDANETAPQASGRDITASVPADWAEGLPIGTAVTLSIAGAEQLSLAVPVTAVRDAGAAPYLLVQSQETDAGPRRVDVALGRSSDGWVELLDSGGLSTGDVVLVTP
ncbi:hypothetical protein C5E10_11595 [Pseudoclavibacter sp. RFBG4]|nr:hypothetical protein C5E10_11595 [Pseudoclavibacter sp. RFBG4]